MLPTSIGYMAGLRVVVDSQVPTVSQLAAALVVPWAMYYLAALVLFALVQFPLTVRASGHPQPAEHHER